MSDTEPFKREWAELQASLDRYVEMRASFGLSEQEHATYKALCEREASMLTTMSRFSDTSAA